MTDCPARDQTTRVTTETIVAGTTSVPINAAVTTTAPGTAQTTVPPVSENENGNDSGVSEGEGSTGSNSGSADETETETGPGVVSEVDADSDTETGTDTDSGAGSESSGSDVSAGHDAGHVSHPGAAHGSTSIPYFSLSRIGSATVKVPVAASSPTANADAGAGQGAGTSTESGNLPSASPVFNGASSFAVSSVVSAVGAVAALAFFL